MQFQRYCCGNHVSCILLALGGLECYFEKVLWIFFFVCCLFVAVEIKGKLVLQSFGTTLAVYCGILWRVWEICKFDSLLKCALKIVGLSF